MCNKVLKLIELLIIISLLMIFPVFATSSVLNDYIGENIYFNYPFLSSDLVDKSENYEELGLVKGKDNILGKNMWQYLRSDITPYLLNKKKFISDDYTNELTYEIIRLNEKLKLKNKTLYFMITPLKESIYPEYLPDNMYKYNVGDDDVKRFSDKITEMTGVTCLYPINELLEAKKYMRLYFLIDGHWNQLAGYIATCALYEKMGMPIKKLADQKITRDDDNYNYTIDYNGRGGIVSEWYEGDYPYATQVKYTSTAPDGKTVTIIGDSFRYWIAFLLRKDFTKCNILHRASLKEQLMSTDISEADVIIIQAVPSAYKELINIVKFCDNCI